MSEQNELFQLHKFIVEHYNLDEMKSLCFSLQVNYEDLSGDTISAKSRELIIQIGKEERLDKLLVELERLRPTPFLNGKFSTEDDNINLLYKCLPSFTESKIDTDHYFELLELAFSSKNYSEVYRYATVLIEEPSNKDAAWAWLYKGLSAGYLSNTDNLNFAEMTACIDKARALGINLVEDDVNWLAIEVSYIVAIFIRDLVEQLEALQDVTRSNTPRTYVPPQKTMADSIGAGLGAGIGDAMRQNTEAKQFAIKAGNKFQSHYASPIIQGLNFAWSISKVSRQNAINIKAGVNSIIGTRSLNANTRSIFKDQASELIRQIAEAHPDFEFLEVEKDSRCFIATAAMGSPEHPDVIRLREFRNIYLIGNSFGKNLVELYYYMSPPLANIIATRKSLRKVTYFLIVKPLITFINQFMLTSPPD